MKALIQTYHTVLLYPFFHFFFFFGGGGGYRLEGYTVSHARNLHVR